MFCGYYFGFGGGLIGLKVKCDIIILLIFNINNELL